MENNQKKYNITDKQEMYGIKNVVQEVAENMCCLPEWCTVEEVVNTDSDQKEVFSHYAISATAVDTLTGEDKQIEIAYLTINGSIIRDYGDLHPEILQQIEEASAPDINPDLINEHTAIESRKSDLVNIEDFFEER